MLTHRWVVTGDGVTTDLLATGVDLLQLTHPQPQALMGANAVSDPEGSLNPHGFNPPKMPPSIIDDLKRAEQQWAENNIPRERVQIITEKHFHSLLY